MLMASLLFTDTGGMSCQAGTKNVLPKAGLLITGSDQIRMYQVGPHYGGIGISILEILVNFFRLLVCLCFYFCVKC